MDCLVAIPKLKLDQYLVAKLLNHSVLKEEDYLVEILPLNLTTLLAEQEDYLEVINNNSPNKVVSLEEVKLKPQVEAYLEVSNSLFNNKEVYSVNNNQHNSKAASLVVPNKQEHLEHQKLVESSEVDKLKLQEEEFLVEVSQLKGEDFLDNQLNNSNQQQDYLEVKPNNSHNKEVYSVPLNLNNKEDCLALHNSHNNQLVDCSDSLNSNNKEEDCLDSHNNNREEFSDNLNNNNKLVDYLVLPNNNPQQEDCLVNNSQLNNKQEDFSVLINQNQEGCLDLNHNNQQLVVYLVNKLNNNKLVGYLEQLNHNKQQHGANNQDSVNNKPINLVEQVGVLTLQVSHLKLM